jgi:TrmH family RNA methyltransferase
VITKAQVKDIRALATSKGRQEQGAYVAEGDKLAREWLTSEKKVQYIVGLDSWLNSELSLIDSHPEAKVISVSQEELGKISTQQAPNKVLVVTSIPAAPVKLPDEEWCVVLDSVQDPGNLGSIIRIADWFAIPHIICSPGCADFYNPKVVGAGMGGHLRVQLHSATLSTFLTTYKRPVVAATLGGKSMYNVSRQEVAALIIGNESKGISKEIMGMATMQVAIPRRGGAESLNAAVSAGILLAVLGPV